MQKTVHRLALPGTVVIGKLSKEVRSRIAGATGREPVNDPREPGVLVVDKIGGKAREAWQKVNDIVGDEGVVVPILEDSEGHRLLPTGRIEVRFKVPVAAGRLKEFAKRHGLKLEGQNRWNKLQASFAIEPKDKRFLMEIVASLEADSEAETAWPDTRAAYRRE
jgi:hypothetical protein